MQVITPPCKYNQTKQLRLPVAILERITFCEETNTLSRPIPGQIGVGPSSIQAELQHPQAAGPSCLPSNFQSWWTCPFEPALAPSPGLLLNTCAAHC